MHNIKSDSAQDIYVPVYEQSDASASASGFTKTSLHGLYLQLFILHPYSFYMNLTLVFIRYYRAGGHHMCTEVIMIPNL